jgi:hypothetical protein
VVDEQLGEDGAGPAYGGTGINGEPIALKVLSQDKATSDKRRRFKDEIAFLARNKHSNIVTVVDQAYALAAKSVAHFM